jgi:hypothetical protein
MPLHLIVLRDPGHVEMTSHLGAMRHLGEGASPIMGSNAHAVRGLRVVKTELCPLSRADLIVQVYFSPVRCLSVVGGFIVRRQLVLSILLLVTGFIVEWGHLALLYRLIFLRNPITFSGRSGQCNTLVTPVLVMRMGRIVKFEGLHRRGIDHWRRLTASNKLAAPWTYKRGWRELHIEYSCRCICAITVSCARGCEREVHSAR